MLNAGQRSYVPATPDCLVPIIPFLATAMTLHSKTLFITGASRGIGLAIALRAARDPPAAREHSAQTGENQSSGGGLSDVLGRVEGLRERARGLAADGRGSNGGF